jgi:DNA repair photolyase
VKTLVDAGVKAGVGMAPLLPGISDRPDQLRAVVEAARAAGATGIWANVLYLKPGTREHFLAELARDWPEHAERYEQLYAQRAYLPSAQTAHVKSLVAELKSEIAPRRRPQLLRPAPEPRQLTLALGDIRSTS